MASSILSQKAIHIILRCKICSLFQRKQFSKNRYLKTIVQYLILVILNNQLKLIVA